MEAFSFAGAVTLDSATRVSTTSFFILCTVCACGAFVSALVAVLRERRRPDQPPVRSRGGRVLTAVLGGLCVFGPLLLLTVWVPRFRDTFKEFKVRLPSVTEFTIGLSNFVIQWPALTCIVLLGLVALFILPAVLRGRWSLYLAFALSVAILCFSILVAVSVFMPLVQLITSVSGP